MAAERKDTTGASLDSITDDVEWTATTFENCDAVSGPFYHGTAAKLQPGDLLMAGYASNYEEGRVSNHIYFSKVVASLAAQLAVALTGGSGRGYVYLIEPTGPFEDDPNVTNKRFKGNPTKSYRSKHPLRIVAEVAEWDEHPRDVITGMVERLAAMRAKGLALIED